MTFNLVASSSAGRRFEQAEQADKRDDHGTQNQLAHAIADKGLRCVRPIAQPWSKSIAIDQSEPDHEANEGNFCGQELLVQ
jgi:hypothetical protein